MNADPNPSGLKPRKPAGGRGNIMALVAVVVLGGLLFWTVSAIQKHNAVQNCLDAGRRDCVALPAE